MLVSPTQHYYDREVAPPMGGRNAPIFSFSVGEIAQRCCCLVWDTICLSSRFPTPSPITVLSRVPSGERLRRGRVRGVTTQTSLSLPTSTRLETLMKNCMSLARAFFLPPVCRLFPLATYY